MALKRICSFYYGIPRLLYCFPQQRAESVDVYTDTDLAGCLRTRKSTGEAEFYSVLRGSGQGLGYEALLLDLGVEVPLRVWTDSSAAIGICSRQGLGEI